MLNRLLGMIYLLMNRETVTASELAERFEVSVRTIYRDVETLSMAGIPVYARKGKNGGISITEQFVFDKMLVTGEEQARILAALASLQETGGRREGEILLKLRDFFGAEPRNWVSIDFSDWSGRRGELYDQIRESILTRKVLVFDYYGQYGGMSHREVEPIQLLFREYTWYLRAFCRMRQEMRLFKVLRMKRVEMRQESFMPREQEGDGGQMEPEAAALLGESENIEEIELRIDGGEAWRIYDRFEEDEITQLPDGSFRIRMRCFLDEWVYGMILSFGPSARVLGPEKVREEVIRRIGKMREKYITKL